MPPKVKKKSAAKNTDARKCKTVLKNESGLPVELADTEQDLAWLIEESKRGADEKKDNKTPTDEELRWSAEKKFAETVADVPDSSSLSPEESSNLIHELRVHQIELKMQNEELRRIQEELEKSHNHYTNLFDFSPTGYFDVDEKGIITRINLTAATMVGIERGNLVGNAFTRIVYKDDQDIYYRYRQILLESEKLQSFELRLVKNGGAEFTALLECLVIKESETDFKRICRAIDRHDRQLQRE